MARGKLRSRLILSTVVAAGIGALLAAAFWPQPVLVDMGTVTRGPMQVTIDEEARTRVRDTYIVSTPVTGQLQRVDVKPGDPVLRGETVVAYMRPTNPAALDVRTREQALAAVTAAEAALRVAQADLNAAIAKRDLSETELSRTEQLVAREIASEAALDAAREAARVAQAIVDTAEAAITMREAEIANAQAQLIGFDDRRLAQALDLTVDDIPLLSPTDGRILRVLQQSETTLPAGTPIMEIGDIESDLEVIVELLSTDAVQVSEGDPVIITDWGGQPDLRGTVVRVEPFGVTQYSALGVEEQRVNAVVAFTSDHDDYAGLGHGFRVEARIVVWSGDDVLIVPSSALFRSRDIWAVFVVTDGLIEQRDVEVGRDNAVDTEVISGLSEGDVVVLYPASHLAEGTKVASRQLE